MLGELGTSAASHPQNGVRHITDAADMLQQRLRDTEDGCQKLQEY